MQVKTVRCKRMQQNVDLGTNDCILGRNDLPSLTRRWPQLAGVARDGPARRWPWLARVAEDGQPASGVGLGTVSAMTGRVTSMVTSVQRAWVRAFGRRAASPVAASSRASPNLPSEGHSDSCRD